MAKRKNQINLKTLNRDLINAPVTLRSRHLGGLNLTIKIGPKWVSNGRWIVRRDGLAVGPILSQKWLRSEEGPVCAERELLLRYILNIHRPDVRFELLAREERLTEELDKVIESFESKKANVKSLTKFSRTRGTYQEDWATYSVFKSEDNQLLGLDTRWVELFQLNHVWRGADGPILDNPEPAAVTLLFTDRGLLPEEAGFAAFAGGYAVEKKSK